MNRRTFFKSIFGMGAALAFAKESDEEIAPLPESSHIDQTRKWYTSAFVDSDQDWYWGVTPWQVSEVYHVMVPTTGDVKWSVDWATDNG